MVDRISELPDDLLSHILSFLPPNFVHTTALLSKRWKPLCKFVVVLRFYDSIRTEEFKCFCRWVDKVMLSLDDNNLPIRVFHLNCLRCPRSGLLHFNHDQWIEAAKLRGVEDLQLSMFPLYNAWELYQRRTPSKSSINFFSVAPNNIFSCRTLVTLKLENLCVAGNILSVDLPSLKTLHLESVYLQNSDDLKKLISKSLVLEDLYVIVGYKESASIPLTTKKIIGPYHVSFKAAIHYEFQKDRFLQLEVRLPNEKIISYYFTGSPIFQNLIHLELVFVLFYGWNDLIDVLQNCPNLEILSIIQQITKCTCPLEHNSISFTNWIHPNSVPKCISSHLRSCTLTDDGMEDSVRFAEYILQNAQLLQVMTFKTTRLTNLFNHRECLAQLNFCPRISPVCKLCVV